jgi:hypothetical protein
METTNEHTETQMEPANISEIPKTESNMNEIPEQNTLSEVINQTQDENTESITEEKTETNDEDEPPEKNIELFNNLLQNYLQMGDEIKDMEAELKNKKNKYKNLTQSLTTYIKVHNIKKVELQGERKGFSLEHVVTKTANVDKVTILDVLRNYFESNMDEFERIMQLISEAAEEKESSKLVMKKPKLLKKTKENDKDRKELNNILENWNPNNIQKS